MSPLDASLASSTLNGIQAQLFSLKDNILKQPDQSLVNHLLAVTEEVINIVDKLLQDLPNVSKDIINAVIAGTASLQNNLDNLISGNDEHWI